MRCQRDNRVFPGLVKVQIFQHSGRTGGQWEQVEWVLGGIKRWLLGWLSRFKPWREARYFFRFNCFFRHLLLVVARDVKA